MSRKLNYIVTARMPTEQAHGLNIAQMCEAYSNLGYDVTLVIPKRRNASLGELSVAEYYGVDDNFKIQRLFTIDLLGILPQRLALIAFFIMSATFYLRLLIYLKGTERETLIYSRDFIFLWLFHKFHKNNETVFDVHKMQPSKIGKYILKDVLQKTTVTVTVTKYLKQDLEALGHKEVFIAVNGYRKERFEGLPDRSIIRRELGLDEQSFVACYTGRLQTFGKSRRLETLIDAFKYCYELQPNWHGILLIVGGPKEYADTLGEYWLKEGMPAEKLIMVGHVNPEFVPKYLIASDVCVSPLPSDQHFSNYTFSIKLLEYMAAGRAILLTDQPALRDMFTHNENALIVPSSDPVAMGQALLELDTNTHLREQIATNAKLLSANYTWANRAKKIHDLLPSSQTLGG